MTDDKRPTAFLIAATLRDATTTATIDWNWRRFGPQRYQTRDGVIVQAVEDGHRFLPDALRGQPHGTPLYFGYGYSGRHDIHIIFYEISNGRFIRMPAPAPTSERERQWLNTVPVGGELELLGPKGAYTLDVGYGDLERDGFVKVTRDGAGIKIVRLK